MPDVFDGYSAWLGIAPNEQPPNHYRLLALKLYESSPEAITRAADLVSTFVSVHSFGQHEAVAKRIMAEVATARETLLNARSKHAYDEALKAELSSGSSPSAASKSALRKAAAVMQAGHAATTTMPALPPRAAEKPRAPSASGISSAKPAAKNAATGGSQICKARMMGEYLIQERIGSGGMGKVFKAQHRKMQRTVAIKMLPPSVVQSAEALRRFYRELHAAGRLIHPNIVAAFDAGEQAGIHYLVMEFVEGFDIATLLKQRGSMAPEVALDYLIQTARGLVYAHGEGIVHRDIKPGNLLVDKKGVVKILDMGLARFGEMEEQTSAGEGLTTTGQIMGTVDYMSPEQAEDTHRVDERTDIYSLGCTAFRMLTNQLPYTGDTVMKKLLAHRTAVVPSAREIVPEVPPRLDALIQRMMAKLPDERPASMREVLNELEACRSTMKAGKPEAAVQSSSKPIKPSPTKMPQSLVDTHSSAKEITSVNIRADGTEEPLDTESIDVAAVRKRWLIIAAIALATLAMFFVAGVMIAHLLEDTSTPSTTETPETPPANIADAAPPDRQAAAWVVESGGRVQVRHAGKSLVIRKAADLPADDFRVEVIDLNMPNVVSGELRNLEGLAELKQLSLNYTKIDDNAVETLKNLPALETLSVLYTGITPAGIAALKEARPNLQVQR